MANTIKIKRGSNANLPSLNEAELAFTTDTKQLYAGTAGGNKELFKDIPFPTGGLTGELLVKKSDADYDAEWQDLLGKVVYKRRIMVGDDLTGKTIYNTFNENDWNIFEEDKNKFLPGQELGSLNIVKANKINDYGNEIRESFSEHGNGEYEGKKILNVYASFYHENFSQWGNVESVDIFSFTEQVGIDKQENVTFINDNNDRIVEEIIDTKAYRKLFIEDSNIRPLKVGDVITKDTKFYFTFPDDLYTDTRVDWSSQIFNTTGSSGFIYMSMGHMGDDYSIYGYFANTAMETIYQYTNSSIINKSFITCGSQAVGEVDSVDDYLGKYVLVDRRTLGA